MQKISLEDLITIGAEESLTGEHKIHITCNNGSIPTDSSNLAWKAADKLLKEANPKDHWEINIAIKKEIPVGAGLGGGSSNAATTLVGLNRLLELGLPQQKLLDIGKTVGSDVPFFILGQTAIARGIGEKLEPFQIPEDFSPSNVTYLLVHPDINLSSKEVYERSNFGLTPPGNNAKFAHFLKEIEGDITQKKLPPTEQIRQAYKQLLINDLEGAAIKMHPIIAKLKEAMLKFGAIGSLMTGSGSAVFGVFTNPNDANRAAIKVKEQLNLEEGCFIGTAHNIN